MSWDSGKRALTLACKNRKSQSWKQSSRERTTGWLEVPFSWCVITATKTKILIVKGKKGRRRRKRRMDDFYSGRMWRWAAPPDGLIIIICDGKLQGYSRCYNKANYSLLQQVISRRTSCPSLSTERGNKTRSHLLLFPAGPLLPVTGVILRFDACDVL